MKLTKRTALEDCIKLWQYLADHPHHTKSKAILNLGMDNYIFDCPCCEFARPKMGNNCNDPKKCLKCPIPVNLWTKEPIEKLTQCIFPCQCKDSPFNKWSEAGTAKTTKKYANKILQLAQESLAQLPKRKTK